MRGKRDSVAWALMLTAFAVVVTTGYLWTEQAHRAQKAEAKMTAYADALAQSMRAICITEGPDARVRVWSKGCENIFGYTMAEMLGEPIDKIIPPDLLDQHNRAISLAVENPSDPSTVKIIWCVAKSKSGGDVPVMIQARRLQANSDALLAIVDRQRDVEELDVSQTPK